MDSIHTPSVPSGSGSGRSFNGPKVKAKSLLELMSEKQTMESELSALGSVLDSVSNANSCLFARRLTFYAFKHSVNMNTTLTTFDGYPRDDLDIAQSV